jgi:hypothetical protein
VTTAIRAAEVLALLDEPPSEEVAAKIRAITNHVASAIEAAYQMDRKAVTHHEMVAFFVAAERACPTISKILIRRRGIAFAGRCKELISYVGRRGMTANQACVLFCTLAKLSADDRLVFGSRDMAFLAANIEVGCGKLSAAEMETIAYQSRTISTVQIAAMLQRIAMEAIRRCVQDPASVKMYQVVLRTVLRSVHLNSGRPAAVELKKKMKLWNAEQEAVAQAAKKRAVQELAFSFAACTVINFLSAAKDINN